MKGTIWCLHGAVGMAEDWKGFAVPGWAVKRVDLWRFLDCCPMALAEFAAALNEEAAAGEGRRVLLGYSMGGRLALHALLAGGPWDAGVIVSAHPGLENEQARVERMAADAAWAGRALTGDWRDFLRRWESQDVLAGAEMEGRDGLDPRRQAVARSFMDWSLGVQLPLWGSLGEVKRPLLWVAGERDEKFKALAKRAVGLLPEAEGWIAESAGHRVPWEVPEAFAGKVGEFLERAVS